MCSSSSDTENSTRNSNSGSDSCSNGNHSDHEIPLAVATVCSPEDDCDDMTELELGNNNLPVPFNTNMMNDSTTAHASSSTAGDDGATTIPIAIATPRTTANSRRGTTTSRNNNNNQNNQDNQEWSTWKKNLLFSLFCIFTFLVLPYVVYRITNAMEGNVDDNIDSMSWGNQTNTSHEDGSGKKPPRRAPFSLP